MNVSEKISLLLRHADRDDIPQGSFGKEILLNEKGKQNAQSFGEQLAERKINRIFTSPVGRCVQTAEYVTKGYGRSIEIIETTALGAPGLHIKDDKIAGEFYLQHGFDEMYKRFMAGKEIPGIPNIKELNIRVTKFINENSTQNGTTIFITHDMLIAFYHFSINKKVYTKDNWINYMTGLTFINGRIHER
ncbi:MAG: phosphoglycerate mutase family protein [bacterium]|nr:phosphoglycerate mutase family protein [bacterium]